MRRIAYIAGAIVLVPILALVALVLVVQSEWGERWAERQVSSRIHRDVELDTIRLHPAWPPIVTIEKLRISNPEWATTKNLVDAEGLTAAVEVMPLFGKHIVVPQLAARKAEAGLEKKGDRATWQFGETQRNPSRIELSEVVLDDGHIVYRDENEDTALDVKAKGTLGDNGEIKLAATGKFRGQAAKGEATLPGLATNPKGPIRFAGNATIGATRATADGTIGKSLESFDLDLRLAGQTLNDLHKIVGIVLPDTPPYNLAGRLRHSGKQWVFDPFSGKIGDSDMRGNLAYSKEGKRPFLRAKLESKMLDFDDLGPLVGAPPKTGPGETAAPKQQVKAATLKVTDRVLPREAFSTARWGEMDADVTLTAARVQRPQQLPLDSLSTHLILKDAVLTLEPLNFGVAGGKIVSNVVIDSRVKPPAGDIKATIENLKMAQLFPTLKTMEDAFGSLYGRAELKGRGASVADLLGTSNGRIVVAANGGRVSDLLTELLEIDVAKAAMLLGTRKQQVDLRCAVGHLDVREGIATPESFVVDTSETNINVSGKIDLAHERLDLETKGRGKSPSLLTLRSPIVVEGPLKKPNVHPKAGPLAVQGAAAAALAVAAPPLAIVPFLSTGSGKDADCDKLLADARQDGVPAQVKTASR